MTKTEAFYRSFLPFVSILLYSARLLDETDDIHLTVERLLRV